MTLPASSRLNPPEFSSSCCGAKPCQGAVDTGADTNTVAKLQALLGVVDTALGHISDFAQRNTVSSTDGDGSNDAYAPGSVKPTEQDYVDTGASHVVAANVAAYNDALASLSIDASKVNTLAGVQTVITLTTPLWPQRMVCRPSQTVTFRC